MWDIFQDVRVNKCKITLRVRGKSIGAVDATVDLIIHDDELDNENLPSAIATIQRMIPFICHYYDQKHQYYSEYDNSKLLDVADGHTQHPSSSVSIGSSLWYALRYVEWYAVLEKAANNGLFPLEIFNEVEKIHSGAVKLCADRKKRDKNNAQNQSTLRGGVYLIRCGDAYKIGISKDVSKRAAQIQTGNDKPIEIVAVVNAPDMELLETQLHGKFHGKRVAGEWFNLDENDVEYIKSLAGNVEMLNGQIRMFEAS
jgi:hypothetical protein